MNANTRELIFSSLGGLTISYAGYFLILQNLRMPSMWRFGLIFILLFSFTAALYLLRNQSHYGRAAIQGIAAIFILLNLIAAIKLDFLNLPYTIPLLPIQSLSLTSGADQTPVQIKSFGTEIYEDLNLEQLNYETGWQLEGKRRLSQLPGMEELLTWTGKPGQYFYIETVNCASCGTLSLSYRGETTSFSLDDSSQNTTIHTYQFPSLVWHKILNFITLEGALLVLSGIFVVVFSLIQNRSRASTTPSKGITSLAKIPPQVWLILFPVVVFGFKIAPVLFNDDWGQIIRPIYEENMLFFDPAARRPMHISLAWVISKIFPNHQAVLMMQIAHLVVIIMIGLVMYQLLARLLGSNWQAVLGALLCIVYPSDYTYFYLSLLGTRFAFFITLLALLLFYKYIKSGRTFYVWISVALVLSGLLTYEGQFGIYLAWPVVLSIITSFKTIKKRAAGLIVYYLPAAIFPVWRVAIQPLFYQDAKIGQLTEGTSGLLTSFIWGIKTILGGFWPPYRDTSWITSKNFSILAGALLLCVLFFLISRQKALANIANNAGVDKANHLPLLAAGALLWVSGYFPIIINYSPNIWGHLSRVNIFSVPGAVLILIALFQMIARGLTPRGNRAVLAVNSGLLFLIMLGAVVHIQVQESFGRTWQDTRSFYQQLFQLAPDLEEDTHLYFYFSGEEKSLTPHRPLITTSWELLRAVEVFYDLTVDVVSYRYQKITVPEFPGLDVIGANVHKEYFHPQLRSENLLALNYDLQTGQLSIIEDISDHFSPQFQQNYQPFDHILPLHQEIPSRKLVD